LTLVKKKSKKGTKNRRRSDKKLLERRIRGQRRVGEEIANREKKSYSIRTVRPSRVGKKRGKRRELSESFITERKKERLGQKPDKSLA